MRLLIADDDSVARASLRTYAARWGYEPIPCATGDEAWRVMSSGPPPELAVLDWEMPGIDGVSLCRQIRETSALESMYIILLTGNQDPRDVLRGLESGADDYITKPFRIDQLRARLGIGRRIVGLQQTLATRVTELEEALANVKTLSGLLPICAYCKRIRDDGGYWNAVERYLAQHSDATFSHGICPECLTRELER